MDSDQSARLRGKVRQLQVLASHPGTSDVERENALARIAEIQDRLSALSGEKKSRGPRRGLSGLSALRRAVRGRKEERRDPDEVWRRDWPFGWLRREAALDENVREVDDGLVLEWSCPGCGRRVWRRVGSDELLRVSGRPGGRDELLERLLDGRTCLLCARCWVAWNEG